MSTLAQVPHAKSPGAVFALQRVIAAAVAASAGPAGVAAACVGTDRSTGDSLGPLVGQKLLRLGMERERVIGCLEEPLHALNLTERIGALGSALGRPLLIAVDAALGPHPSVGSIVVTDTGVVPGIGVGKVLDRVGDIGITGTVNVRSGPLDTQVLQSTRLHVVMEMVEVIATAIWWGIRSAENSRAPRKGALAHALQGSVLS